MRSLFGGRKRKCGICEKRVPRSKTTTIKYTALDGEGEFFVCDECRDEYLTVEDVVEQAF